MPDPSSPSDPFDAATFAFYASEAPVYAARRPSGASHDLTDFLARLPPGARILDPGCGGGQDSEAMLARGFAVDPADRVAEITAQAEQRLKKPVAVMRFDELDAVEAYDGIWAHASLLHVPRSALPAILQRIWRALRPGGFHFAIFKGGGIESRDGFGRYFNCLTLDQTIAPIARRRLGRSPRPGNPKTPAMTAASIPGSRSLFASSRPRFLPFSAASACPRGIPKYRFGVGG
jgi:SAM-dependent methyltransferase